MSNIQDLSHLYDDFTKDAATADADRYGKATFFKPKPGSNVLRMLPAVKGAAYPWVVAHQHFFNWPGVGDVSFNCPRLTDPDGTHDKRCAVCMKIEQLRKTGSDSDRKMADDMRGSRRVFSKVIDREEPQKGVQVYAFGSMVHDRLVYFRGNDAFGNKDFTNPQTGFDLIISKTGSGMQTRYATDLAREPSPLGKNIEQMVAWLEASIAEDLSRRGAPLEWNDHVAKLNPAAGAAASASASAPQQQAAPASAMPMAIDTTATETKPSASASTVEAGMNVVHDDDVPF